MPFDQAKLDAELSRDEGRQHSPYRDTEGHMTIGIGHNLDVAPLPAGTHYPISDAW
jgi:lysozyme